MAQQIMFGMYVGYCFVSFFWEEFVCCYIVFLNSRSLWVVSFASWLLTLLCGQRELLFGPGKSPSNKGLYRRRQYFATQFHRYTIFYHYPIDQAQKIGPRYSLCTLTIGNTYVCLLIIANWTTIGFNWSLPIGSKYHLF
jgi:hypothetical protein